MKKLLLYIGLVLAAVGCTKEDALPSLDDNVVSITSNIATRVTGDNWDKNDAIGVYMSAKTFGDLGANAEYVTTSGDGKFSSSDPLYYPINGGSAELLAYYPYVADVEAAEYLIDSKEQVDLLSAKKSDVINSKSGVSLVFEHQLSKVSLTLKAGEGLESSDLEGMSVELSGISTTASFNLIDGEVNNDLGDKGELEIKLAEDNATASAIVIPQSLSGATFLFSTKDYGVFSAKLSTSEFKLGKEYKYNITIKRNGVEITQSNIDPWGDGGIEDGTAELYNKDLVYDNGVYKINSAKGLAAYRDLVNGAGSNTSGAKLEGDPSYFDFTKINTSINGLLLQDIDWKNETWTPIGVFPFEDIESIYSGTFDGGGFDIKNLSMDAQWGYRGLFSVIYMATIKNVSVSGTLISEGESLGGIAGAALMSTITNCHNHADLTGYDYAGGLVGNAVSVVFDKCSNTGDIKGAGFVGGIVGGFVEDGSFLFNSYNSGSVDGNHDVGGVIGTSEAVVVNCYNVGAVSVTNSENGGNIGGIVGGNSGAIFNSFSAGTVSGSAAYQGGVSGQNYQVKIEDCYWNKDIYDGSGAPSYGVANSIEVTGLSTSEMKDASFATIMNNNAVNYNDSSDGGTSACAWKSGADGYPVLDTDAVPESKADIELLRNGKYYIYTAQGLRAFADLVNGVKNTTAITKGGIVFSTEAKGSIDGVLINDVDMSEVCYKVDGTPENDINWTPIGKMNDVGSAQLYSGVFDGGGFCVKNLYINTTKQGQGLFGTVHQASIKNVSVTGSISSTTDYIGGVVGKSSNTNIFNCSNHADVSGYEYVAGIVGKPDYATINKCYNTGSIEGLEAIGGIAGMFEQGESCVYNSYNTGTIKGSNYVSGVVGISYGYIINCYNLGDLIPVSSSSVSSATFGGVAGYSNNFIANCYSAGTIIKEDGMGDSFMGSLIGNNDGIVESCYWDSDVYSIKGCGSSITENPVQITGMTTSQMKYRFYLTLSENRHIYNSDPKFTVDSYDWIVGETQYPTINFNNPAYND